MKTSEFKKQYYEYKKANPSRNQIPPLEKHSNHQVEIREVRSSKHYGKYWCLDCDSWIAWISKKEWQQAKALGLVVEDPIKNIKAGDILG